ncbi:MAG TPA: hypothetical protein DCE41_29030 [Cytophagales bacterium]|nr:hypothetical protein [Cytophagales bacterium]HAA20382.1 hypothetical protein [Cytophagales bacterium]HAP62145.1 hypothetical protein [Cytophagales bacterium]
MENQIHPPPPLKIVVFGASGSGTTTLGKGLAQALGAAHLDADDYYWVPTEPPFQNKVSWAERNENLQKDFYAQDRVVVSGSLVSWAAYWTSAFHLAVFLQLPSEVRMHRLRVREEERHGDALHTDPKRKAISEAFLEWAAQYDDPHFDGRSLQQHQQWMQQLTCPVLTLAGDLTREIRLSRVMEKIKQLARFQS